MEHVFQSLFERLTRQGLNEAAQHFSQAQSAFDRSEWESANSQVRAALESLFNSVARLRLNTSKTGGTARQELEKAGFTREQAEVSMKLLVETMNENFATKADFKEMEWRMNAMETRLESKIQGLDSKIQVLDTKLDSNLKELEYKLTIKLGTMMTIAIGVTGTLVKLLSNS